MFEAELELEKRSSFIPLVLTVSLLLVVVGTIAGIVFMVYEGNRGASAADVTPIVAATLKAEGTPALHFSSGYVRARGDESPGDPHYRLLEKAGIVQLHPDKKTGAVQVTMTPAGNRLLDEVPGTQKTRKPDGTVSYLAPLAERRLMGIARITMTGPNAATVEYTWKWEPTRLGDVFELSGPNVKAFTTWDRSVLIEKYGVAFYHGEPAKEAIALVRKDNTWMLRTE